MGEGGFVAVAQDERRDATKWLQLAMLPLNDVDASSNARLAWIALHAADTPLSRDDIARTTGLPYSSVHDAVDDLADAGLVTRLDQEGRRAALYTPSQSVIDGVTDAIEEVADA